MSGKRIGGTFHWGYDPFYFAVAFSQDSRMIAVAGDDAVVELYHFPEITLSWQFRHTSSVVALAFHPSGNEIAIGGTDGVVQIVTIAPVPSVEWLDGFGMNSVTFTSFPDIMFSDDDGELIVMGARSTIMRWDVASMRMMQRTNIGDTYFRFTGERFFRAFFWTVSPAANRYAEYIALPGEYNSDGVYIWSLDETVLAHLERLSWGIFGYPSMTLSHDGHTLALNLGDTVTLRDVETGKLTQIFLPNRMRALEFEFSADDRLLAVSGRCGVLYLIDVETETILDHVTLDAGTPGNMEFSADGTRIAFVRSPYEEMCPSFSYHIYGDLFVWDIPTDQLHFVSDEVHLWWSDFTINHDGSVVAATRSDSSYVELWDVERYELIARYQTITQMMTFNHAGTMLATVGYDGVIRLWAVPAAQTPIDV